MLPVFPRAQLYLYTHPTDMRKNFDGLCGIISAELGRNPLGGDIFAFVNRRRDKMKLLVWDRPGSGFSTNAWKKGRYKFPKIRQTNPPLKSLTMCC